MSAFASLSKGLGKGGLPLLIGVGTVAFVVVHYLLKKDLVDGKKAVGEAISGATEVIGGIATGRNAVTADTPYWDTGIFGTFGASINEALGGAPQAVGEYAGGKLYDWFGDGSADNSQSATGNPYSPTGPNASYREAANNSPVNSQYAASPLTGYDGSWY